MRTCMQGPGAAKRPPPSIEAPLMPRAKPTETAVTTLRFDTLELDGY